MINKNAEAGDVIEAPMYIHRKGNYKLDVQYSAGGKGSGLRIECDGIVMPDNTVKYSLLPFTEFDPEGETLHAEFSVPGDCRVMRLIISYGGEGELRVWTTHYESLISGHILSATHAVILCLICALAGIRQVFRKTVLIALIKAVLLTILLNLWFIVPFLSMAGDDINMVVSGTDISHSAVFLPQMFQWIVNTAGRGTKGVIRVRYREPVFWRISEIVSLIAALAFVFVRRRHYRKIASML